MAAGSAVVLVIAVVAFWSIFSLGWMHLKTNEVKAWYGLSRACLHPSGGGSSCFSYATDEIKPLYHGGRVALVFAIVTLVTASLALLPAALFLTQKAPYHIAVAAFVILSCCLMIAATGSWAAFDNLVVNGPGFHALAPPHGPSLSYMFVFMVLASLFSMIPVLAGVYAWTRRRYTLYVYIPSS